MFGIVGQRQGFKGTKCPRWPGWREMSAPLQMGLMNVISSSSGLGLKVASLIPPARLRAGRRAGRLGTARKDRGEAKRSTEGLGSGSEVVGAGGAVGISRNAARLGALGGKAEGFAGPVCLAVRVFSRCSGGALGNLVEVGLERDAPLCPLQVPALPPFL